MEKNDKQPKGFSEVLDFIEKTREGKFTERDVSITELLKFSISREEVSVAPNEISQPNEIILYGLS
ncbi:MAG: hypothetical protein Q4E32_02915 [Bacteroidales bacterium]|nr:hypothetical protein [Bacteroidales bacterium]